MISPADTATVDPGTTDPGASDRGAHDFDLPEALIAQTPIEPRHASRLLVLDRRVDPGFAHPDRGLTDAGVTDLPQLLAPGTLLVVNDTRVVPARLLGRKDSGGRVELLLVRPFARTGALHDAGLLAQPVLFKSSKGLRPGQRLHLEPHPGKPAGQARVVAVGGGGTATVDLGGAADLAALLQACGHVPLPPYIRGGKDDPDVDRDRYQCTYAGPPGAVAAPTAGLHLSTEVLAALAAAGVERCAVTLHVGPGTFLPVRVADLREHRVQPERFVLSAETAERLQAALRDGRPIVAVGTTTTRALETAALRAEQAGTRLQAQETDADLTILPGHQFRVVGGLMTNFHLPRSSLLVLVAALAGRERVLAAYRHAVARGYRFYSYGDAMLVR